MDHASYYRNEGFIRTDRAGEEKRRYDSWDYLTAASDERTAAAPDGRRCGGNADVTVAVEDNDI